MEESIKNLIENNPVSLATIGEDGNPHCIVVAYVKVLGGKLLITDNYMNKTRSNIQNNPNVNLTVFDKDWQGCGIKGVAEYHPEGEWHEKVKELTENKQEPCKGAILVEITNIKKLI